MMRIPREAGATQFVERHVPFLAEKEFEALRRVLIFVVCIPDLGFKLRT
jgi:hypothetical protein